MIKNITLNTISYNIDIDNTISSLFIKYHFFNIIFIRKISEININIAHMALILLLKSIASITYRIPLAYILPSLNILSTK